MKLKFAVTAISAAMLLGACASNTGLGNSVTAGAYGDLSPKWEKAVKAEAKAQNLIDKGEARVVRGEKQIKAAEKNIREGEKKVLKGQEEVSKGTADLAKAKSERENIEADYKKRLADSIGS